MPWVKTKVGDRVNQTIEDVQERMDLNKSEATLHLLKLATESYDRGASEQ